jgi:hypothetical protein
MWYFRYAKLFRKLELLNGRTVRQYFSGFYCWLSRFKNINSFTSVLVVYRRLEHLCSSTNDTGQQT